jgi:3-phytase
VVERDNRRLQILRLPGFEPLGAFGEEHLERPYGLAVVPLESAVDVFVTDNFEAEPGKALSPERLAERVEHFHVSVENGALASERIGAFGEASGKGVLTKVESIGADGARKIVLVADEDPAQLRYKIYDTSGNYRSSLGQGLFRVEPEGIALYDCGESGLWVAVDQDERLTRFHLFDREGLEHLGSFTGAATGNTDGIALTSRSFRDFPRGALFAVDDDQAISAFDWAQIEAGLGLESRCGGSQQ